LIGVNSEDLTPRNFLIITGRSGRIGVAYWAEYTQTHHWAASVARPKRKGKGKAIMLMLDK